MYNLLQTFVDDNYNLNGSMEYRAGACRSLAC